MPISRPTVVRLITSWMHLQGSRNEFKKWFAKYARSKGSNLFFAHYPAFGQPGCEYERTNPH
jgi:hypothetical protein